MAGHALTLAFLDASMDDAVGIAVAAVFGVGSLLSLIGFLVAGTAMLRAGQWTSWRRYVPIAIAVAMLVVLPLQFTPLLPLSVALYSATIVAFGVALLAEGGGRGDPPAGGLPRALTDIRARPPGRWSPPARSVASPGRPPCAAG